MNPRILYSLFLVLVGLSLIIFYPYPTEEKQLPVPFETIIMEGEDDNKHIKKQEWLEMMHRSAPEDNWRSMDQLYRMNSLAGYKGSAELPLYGKWRELGSNNLAGRTVYTYLDIATEEIYTAADGGQIWKGEIGSDNWVSLNDPVKIPAIRFLTKFVESDFSRLLVHSEAFNTVGIMYSDDDGQTWTLANGLGDVANWGFIKRTVVQNNSNKTVYCTSLEWDYDAWQVVSCIYKSVDLGESFEKIHSFDHNVDLVDIWTSQKEESAVYVVAKDEFYYLDDSDNLVSVASLPNSQNGKTLLAGFDTGSGLFFYTMMRFDNLCHFFSSGVDGQNWIQKGSHSQGPFMLNSFAASAIQKDLLYFGGMEAFTSPDAGETWNLVNGWSQYYGSPEDKLHADIPSFNSFMMEGDTETLFINTDGGTYISYDQAETVENISLNNLRISQYYSSYTCRFDPSYTHAGSQDQGYQKSDQGLNQGAINYNQAISGDYGNMVSGDDGSSLWMVYPGFAMYGPDVNNSNYLILENFVGSNYQWLPKLMEDYDDPEIVYLAGGNITSGAHIMLLERVGPDITYTELPFDFSNGTNATISALSYSKIDHAYWYVLTSERDFFYSMDEGETWTETDGFEGPGSHYFYGASIAPSKSTLGLVYAGGSGYSNPAVYRSLDNGVTFEAYSDSLPNTMVFQIVLSEDDSLLFAATEVGAFVCKTWEDKWYPLADSIVPDQAFWAVDFVDTLKLARFSTYGRGIWDFELEPDVEADFMASDTLIVMNETLDFTDLSTFSPISWEWQFEGGSPETSSEQNPSGIQYSQPGTYDVMLIASNDHSTDTLIKTEYVAVTTISGGDDQHGNDISIYPNPATTLLSVETTQAIDRISIYSITGRLYLTLNKPTINSHNTIDISELPIGIYLVEVLHKNEKIIVKIIKE